MAYLLLLVPGMAYPFFDSFWFFFVVALSQGIFECVVVTTDACLDMGATFEERTCPFAE